MLRGSMDLIRMVMAECNEPPGVVSDEQWQACLNDLGIPNADIRSKGRGSRGRRVYQHQDRIYKIAFLGYDEDTPRKNDLQSEFQIVKSCQKLTVVPRTVKAEVRNQYEVAIYQRVSGELLSDRSPGFLSKLPLLMRLASALLRISWLGISHNDLFADNVMIRTDGSVVLIDFDQATRASFSKSLYRNFFSLNSAVVPASFLSLLWSIWNRWER